MKKNLKNKRNNRKVKINYFKMIRSLLILIMIIYFIVLGTQSIISDIKIKEERAQVQIEYTTYYVSKGETLWTIAQQQDYIGDIRDVVSQIKEDNNINGNLTIGQEIQLRNIY